MLSPVVLFVYNRPEHTKKALRSLANNPLAKDSVIYIFSDAAKNERAVDKVQEVRNYIHSDELTTWFLKVYIIEAEKNKGLADSIISGVTTVMNKYGRAIVIEDDNEVSTDYLQFMNDCLEFYEKNKKIWSIGSYNIMDIRGTFPMDEYKKDVFILGRTCSYSWASWKDRWDKVDWKVKDYSFNFLFNFVRRKKFNYYGNDRASMLDFQMASLISSWAIRFDYAEFVNKAFTVYPSHTKSNNIGMDGSGVHNKAVSSNNTTQADLSEHAYHLEEELEEDRRLRDIYVKYFFTTKKAAIKQYIKAFLCRHNLMKRWRPSK